MGAVGRLGGGYEGRIERQQVSLQRVVLGEAVARPLVPQVTRLAMCVRCCVPFTRLELGVVCVEFPACIAEAAGSHARRQCRRAALLLRLRLISFARWGPWRWARRGGGAGLPELEEIWEGAGCCCPQFLGKAFDGLNYAGVPMW